MMTTGIIILAGLVIATSLLWFVGSRLLGAFIAIGTAFDKRWRK